MKTNNYILWRGITVYTLLGELLKLLIFKEIKVKL